MLPLDLILARCALFWALPAQLNTFSPCFCFLSELELEDLTATPGMVCTALPNPVCGKGRGQIPEQCRGLDLCKGRGEHTQHPQPLLCQLGSALVQALLQ